MAHEIHNVLPQEMFIKILKMLDYETMNIARRVCKKWEFLIDEFKLTKFCLKKICKCFCFSSLHGEIHI